MFSLFFSVKITYMIPISKISSNSIFRPIKFSIGERNELKKDELENEDASAFDLLNDSFFEVHSLL